MDEQRTHFVNHVGCTKAKPALIIPDGHPSHTKHRGHAISMTVSLFVFVFFVLRSALILLQNIFSCSQNGPYASFVELWPKYE